MKKMYILALLSALICGFLLYTFLGNVKTQGTAGEIPKKEVLVAAADIPAYADLNAGMFKKEALPLEGLHPQAVTDYEQIEGKKSSNSFLANEVILFSKFDQNIDSMASYRIPEGMRIITIKVSDDSGLAQYIVPGDMVDVVFSAFDTSKQNQDSNQNTQNEEGYYTTQEVKHTYLANGVEVTESVTSVILENVEVFTTGGALDADGVAYSTVTLILSPADCLKLYASENYGSFTLVLRAHNDAAPAGTGNVFAEDILPAA